MRVDSAAAIIAIICLVVAIYFAGLSVQNVDFSLKTTFLCLAISFFVGGIVVLLSLMVLLAIGLLVSKTEMVT